MEFGHEIQIFGNLCAVFDIERLLKCMHGAIIGLPWAKFVSCVPRFQRDSEKDEKTAHTHDCTFQFARFDYTEN